MSSPFFSLLFRRPAQARQLTGCLMSAEIRMPRSEDARARGTGVVVLQIADPTNQGSAPPTCQELRFLGGD